MLTATGGHAQSDYDSLKQKILKMDAAINTIHLNLTKSHKQFKTGTLIMIAGAAMSLVGVQIISKEAGDSNNNYDKPHLLYGGLALTTVGTIIQIDSHKWIGRGGRRERK